MSKAKEGETMGQRVQRFRQEAGLSQSELAAKAGVPVPTLRNWEQERSIPRVDFAAKVAKALGRPLDEIVGDVAIPTEPKKLRRPGRPRKDKD
jgi:transcriptional regulator with XRE-family HTH domain